jgi:hypothetical protein
MSRRDSSTRSARFQAALGVAVIALGLGGCPKETGGWADGAGAAAPEVAPVAAAPEVDGEAGPEVVARPAEGALRGKLLELAVAGECLRRSEVEPGRARDAMDALYRGHGVALEVYAREMAILSADAKFAGEVEGRLARCDEVVRALLPSGAGEAADAVGEPEEVAGGAVGGEAEVRGGEDAAAAAEDAAMVEADTVVVEVEVVEPGDTVVVEPKPEKKPEPRVYTGTWSGPLTGTTNGTLRVTVQGRTITGAAATVGRATLRLKGSLSENGVLTLGGTGQADFLRVNGKIDRAGQAITGTWDGVLDRKRGNGRFRIAK